MAKVKGKTLQKAAKRKAPAKAKEVKKQNVVASAKGKIMRGWVSSAKLAKTATVVVEYRKTHPLYGKSFRRSKKFLVHDEVGVKEGDIVEIHQIRPISKYKRFAVVKITGQNIEAIVTEQLKEDAAEEIAEVMPAEKVSREEKASQAPQGEEKSEEEKTRDTRGTRKSRGTSSKKKGDV